jgi:uncharacterized protein YcbX
MNVSEIWIYPVKSLGGIRLKESEVEERGLKYDRRWMIVDEDGTFLTQRTHSKMALIDVALDTDALILTSRSDQQSIKIPFQPVSGEQISTKVWNDEVIALTVSDTADTWLSEQLDKNVRLVIMPEWAERKADPEYAKNNDNVSFADGFPYMVISQASLDNLNHKSSKTLTMSRFRPNFVITGTAPHEEDNWIEIRIGSLEFSVVKPCSRCILTTIDPDTGLKGPEPLKTLSTYRKLNNKILFGQNMVVRNRGKISENDSVVILQTK